MRMRKMRKKRKRKKRAITNYSSVSGTPTSGLIISGIQPEVFLKSIPQYPFIKQKLSQINSKSYRFSPTDLAIPPFKNKNRAIAIKHYSFVSGFCIPTSGITGSICKINPSITYDKAKFKPNQFIKLPIFPTNLAIPPVKNTKRAITNYNRFRFTISGIKPEIL